MRQITMRGYGQFGLQAASCDPVRLSRKDAELDLPTFLLSAFVMASGDWKAPKKPVRQEWLLRRDHERKKRREKKKKYTKTAGEMSLHYTQSHTQGIPRLFALRAPVKPKVLVPSPKGHAADLPVPASTAPPPPQLGCALGP